MSEWKECRLGEIVDVIDSLHQTPKYSNIGYPMVRVTDIKGGYLETGNTLKVDKHVFEFFSKKHKPKKGDIVMSRVGSYGISCIVKNDINFCLGQNTLFLVPKQNPEFLYYFLNSPDAKSQIESKATGTTQKTISLKSIKEIKVCLPSIALQTAIAEILSSLDDKIELNNKINQELETLAQTLFKQWFIDFEFPNVNGETYKSSGGEMVDSELGEVPKGWEISSLDKIANYLNGLALQKFPPENEFDFLPVIKIRELRQKDTQNSDRASLEIPEKYIVNNGDVLFSWSGSLMIDFWTNGKGALNQHLFKVTSDLFPKWFYYLWTKHHLNKFIEIAESKATTMGHIQRQHLSDAKVLIPQGNYIKEYSLVFEPIISKIIDNRIECVELTNLRDSLIPKLITGEIKI